jgi:hypothetical protein
VAFGGQAQVFSALRDGSDIRAVGQEGLVDSLSWGSALPGGDATMSMSVAMARRYRTPAFEPGRLVEVHRGGPVWRGTMAEPEPAENGGWLVTAQGEGTYGNNFRARFYNTDRPDLDQIIGNAIDPTRAGAMQWTSPGNLNGTPGLDRDQKFESGSQSVTEALNTMTAAKGALTWVIDRYRSRLRIYPLPRITAPTRLLLTADMPGRTLNGYYNAMWVRHQMTEDQSGNPAQFGLTGVFFNGPAARYGALEGYADFANAGVMTGAEPGDRATAILNAYQATAYTQEFTVTPGQVLTLGGGTVDLGTERAGEVYAVIGTAGPTDMLLNGGEVSALHQVCFLSGAYHWDDFAQAARITPYQLVRTDFANLVQAMAPPPAVKVNAG